MAVCSFFIPDNLSLQEQIKNYLLTLITAQISYTDKKVTVLLSPTQYNSLSLCSDFIYFDTGLPEDNKQYYFYQDIQVEFYKYE